MGRLGKRNKEKQRKVFCIWENIKYKFGEERSEEKMVVIKNGDYVKNNDAEFSNDGQEEKSQQLENLGNEKPDFHEQEVDFFPQNNSDLRATLGNEKSINLRDERNSVPNENVDNFQKTDNSRLNYYESGKEKPQIEISSSEFQMKTNITDLNADGEKWVQGRPSKTILIDGRYVIGEPRGTFYQAPFLAKQLGKNIHREDVAADIAVVGELLVFAASFRGGMHYASGSVRQDSFAIGGDSEYGEGQWLIAVIADGVSSASQSHLLADYMTQQTVSVVKKKLMEDNVISLSDIDWLSISRKLVSISQEFCKARAQNILGGERGVDINKISLQNYLSKWATTLEFVVIKASSRKKGEVRSYVHLTIAGDGVAYVINGVKGWRTIKSGKQRDTVIMSNAVTALPVDPGEPQIHYGTLRPGDQFFLTTDGLGDVIGSGDSLIGGFFQREFSSCNNLISFLQIMDVSLYQADDDRTGVLIKEKLHEN